MLVILATIREKDNFLLPPPARDAKTHIRRARSSGRRNLVELRKLCCQSLLLVETFLIVFGDCLVG